MLLLVTDTSGKNGSVALARAADEPKPGGVEVIEESPLAGGTFSAQLVPQIAALLSKHGFRKTDIDAFVVVSGPGSFTGLRVGLAAIKAFAEVLRKPIVPVSLLEALALTSHARDRVVAVLDAGRGDVYAGEYDFAEDSCRMIQERALPKDEFLAVGRESTVVTSDEGLANAARSAGLSVLVVGPVGAGTIARLGWMKLQAGITVMPEELEANYMRRSDAEIFLKT